MRKVFGIENVRLAQEGYAIFTIRTAHVEFPSQLRVGLILVQEAQSPRPQGAIWIKQGPLFVFRLCNCASVSSECVSGERK